MHLLQIADMLRTELLLLLPLVVAVTYGQTNRGYEYYGTSNVRDQRPQPIYGQRPLLLPERPIQAGPVTAAPAASAPAAPASPSVASSNAPALRPRPLYSPGYRPLLPPRPISQVVATPEPQPPVTATTQPPVTESSSPQQSIVIVAITSQEANQPEPAAEQPQPTSIPDEFVPPQREPAAPAVLEPLPEPVPTEEPAPISKPPPTPEPIRPSVVPEAIPQPPPTPEPIRQPDVILKPEPIQQKPKPQPEPIQQLEDIPQPEPILKPEPILQPEPIPQPEPVLQPQPVLQPKPIPQPEPIPKPKPVQQPEPTPQPEPVQEIVQAQEPAILPEREDLPHSEPKPEPVPALQPSNSPPVGLTARYINIPQSPKPGALPPLLPKPEPIREPAFVHHHQQSVPPTNYPVTETYPIPMRTVATQTPPVIVTTKPQPEVTQAPGQIQFDFQCKEGNGYYSVEHECDTYIECKQDRGIKYSCPDGLHFNPAAKHYEYPCAYPSEVKCMVGAEEQKPKPTHTCPNQYGFYSINDGDCSKYIMCQEGLATIMNCPAGLAFNPEISSCDWPANVPQCNPNVFKDFTCPDPPKDEYGQISDIIYKYRYGQQCKLYIACQLGHPRLLSCESGLSFDVVSQSCINEDYVTDCSVPYLRQLQ